MAYLKGGGLKNGKFKTIGSLAIILVIIIIVFYHDILSKNTPVLKNDGKIKMSFNA